MTTDYDLCESVIAGIDSFLAPATEEYSDISGFMTDSMNYLEVMERKNSRSREESLFTEPVSTGGIVTESVDKACQDLIKVQAYTEALYIAQKYMDKLIDLVGYVSKEEQKNLAITVDEMQEKILDMVKLRDEYTSKRRSVISRYATLLKK